MLHLRHALHSQRLVGVRGRKRHLLQRSVPRLLVSLGQTLYLESYAVLRSGQVVRGVCAKQAGGRVFQVRRPSYHPPRRNASTQLIGQTGDLCRQSTVLRAYDSARSMGLGAEHWLLGPRARGLLLVGLHRPLLVVAW